MTGTVTTVFRAPPQNEFNMKPNLCLYSFTILCVSLLFTTGCGQAPRGEQSTKDTPVTGKPSDAPVELKAQWKPGNRYVMRMEMEQSSTFQFGPRPATQDTSFGQDYALSVTNTTDGLRGLELEILALNIESSYGDNTVLRYDSLNKVTPNEGPGVDAFDKIIGGKIRFLMNAENQVTKVDGLKELMDRVDAAPAGGGGGRRGGRGGLGMMAGVLRGSFTVDYFKQILDVHGLPSKPVQIGETWTTQKEVPAPMVGTLLVNTTNVLKGWQQREGKKCARIEFTGSITTKPGKADPTPWGGTMKIEDGRVTGTTWFAPEIGLSVETVVAQNYNLTGTRPNIAQRRGTNASRAVTNATPEKFTSPMRQNITLKLVEVTPLDQAAAPAPAQKQ